MTMKTEEGMEFPREAYAYVGDPEKVETWKLRIWETPDKKVTVAQLGRAAAALSPGGFRGQPVDLPAEAVAGVKARIRAAYKQLGAEAPASVAASASPRFMIALGEIPAEGLVRTALARLGRWAKGKLTFAITRVDLASIVSNFRKRGQDVVIDYEHGNVYAAPGEPVPASGWIKAIEDAPDGEGVLWGLVDWTEKARAMIAAKEYRFLSPVLNWATRDNRTGEQQGATITSAALTNVPVLDMPAIALSEAGWIADEGREEKAMVKRVVLADRAAGTVRAILEDGTESTLAVEGLMPEVKPVVLSEVVRTGDGRFDFAALSASERPIAPEVIRAMFVGQDLDAAVAAGKVTPAQRPVLEKLPLADLRTFIASAQQQVNLTARGIGGSGDPADAKATDSQIVRLADEKCAADKTLQFDQAVDLVLSEHPDLKTRTLKR